MECKWKVSQSSACNAICKPRFCGSWGNGSWNLLDLLVASLHARVQWRVALGTTKLRVVWILYRWNLTEGSWVTIFQSLSSMFIRILISIEYENSIFDI